MVWNRKRFKENGKKSFLKNYGFCVAVCFLVAFIVGEASDSIKIILKYDDAKQQAESTVGYVKKYTTEVAVDEMLEDIKNKVIDSVNSDGYSEQYDENISMQQFGDIFIEDIIRSTVSQNVIFTRIYEANKDFIENHRIQIVITIAIGTLIITLFKIFIGNLLIVGKRRFFLENRIKKNYKTPIGTLLHDFKKGVALRTVSTMFFKDLYQVLWSLTIVGGVIKAYEYRVIPYILAEDSKLTRKQIFKLSKEMMRGYKWKLFVFDITFLPWNILQQITIGLTGLFYSVPYKQASTAEAYIAIRNEMITEKKEAYELITNPLFNE